jgi:CMP-N,N'-diacetyllegionaminic acid synthase
MIDAKTILAIIPARGGSKGIKGKNLLKVHGKPLLAWSIEQAKASLYIDRLVLSSEDEEIIKVAKSYGCEVPFVRPRELATDVSPTIDTIHHAMSHLDKAYDYLVLLQATSPLRTSGDIDRCISICHKGGVSSCVSFTEVEQSPFWMYRMHDDSRMIPILGKEDQSARRQDNPKCYIKNGAVYVARWESLLDSDSFVTNDTLPYIMPHERSLDIDTPLDLLILEAYLNRKNNSKDFIKV